MSDPIVVIEQGKLLGRTSTDFTNKTFYSFQGIPYARPPIGELRFKSPQPAESWNGIRDATKEGSECFSRHMIFQNIIGSEDCLFLNVFTPELPAKDVALKPVMVWIHGGSFKSGSSKTDIYGPEFLVSENIVLVTINYRLGIFGFLQMEDPNLEVPGNAAMKDMILALKWVQTNIEKFCGDPNNVTIFGESAGGASVHHLVLSPLGKGLFHKAIAQSGCAINPFATGRNDIISQIASILNLTNATEKTILQELRGLSAQQLFDLFEKVISACDALNDSAGRLHFSPLIEKPSSEAFLSEEPWKILKNGSYNNVPIIFGYTNKEGMLIELKIRPRLPGMPSNFESLVPYYLKTQHSVDVRKKIAQEMKEFYYKTANAEQDINNFYDLHTDNYFFRDILFAAEIHAKQNNSVYLYRMSVETRLNLYRIVGNFAAPGVCHGDDLGYLFKTKITPPLKEGSLEDLSVRRFIRYWANFAKYGNPNRDNKDIAEWRPLQEDQTNFIDIGEAISLEQNPEPERANFWKQIYELYDNNE